MPDIEAYYTLLAETLKCGHVEINNHNTTATCGDTACDECLAKFAGNRKTPDASYECSFTHHLYATPFEDRMGDFERTHIFPRLFAEYPELAV
jgi:hypothetical protein